LRAAVGVLRTGLRDGKTWDQAFGALTGDAKRRLADFWQRAGLGRTSEAEKAAAGLGGAIHREPAC
jgi:hypothetical protein